MSLETAIKKTIGYGKRYGSNLTLDEIKERLISGKVYSDKEIEKYKTPPPCGHLPLTREVLIKTRKAEGLVKKYLIKFEDILMVGITGSVAAGSPKKNDDIDLILITKKNKLWWTRLKLRYFIYKNKIPHRKYEKKENKDEFCFNLWLSEDNLLISKNRQNLRTAMDLILMKPILNRNEIYQKFILKNYWVKKWVATGYNKKISNDKFLMMKQNPSALRAPPLDKGGFIFFIINILLFIPQYLFMKRKMKSGEEVGLKKAYFNKN